MHLFQAKSNRFLMAAAWLCGVSIPVSTAGQNIGAALLVFLFVYKFSDWKDKKNIAFQFYSLTGIAFGILLALGTTWTTADQMSAWAFFWKMRAFYLIPVFLIVFSNENIRNIVLFGFCFASLLTVLISCLSAGFNYPVFKGLPGDWFVFKTHTYHNFYAGIAAVGLLAIGLTQAIPLPRRVLLAAAVALTSFDILFLVTGRTGQLVFLLMFALVFLMWNVRRGLALLALAAIALALVLPRYSTSFEDGVSRAQSDLQAYSSGNANTPIGMRLAWHANSLQLIMENPLFGHGTGSFKTEYSKVFTGDAHAPLSDNPHNDYLWLSVELGLTGGLLLLGLLISAAWQGRDLQPAWKWTLYALLLGMGVSTLANSFFTDNTTGLAFVVLSCALLNGPRQQGARS